MRPSTNRRAVPFTVDADLDLGATAAPWLRSHGADVRVRRGEVPDALPNPERKGVVWEYGAGRQLVRLPCGLRLLVEGGEQVSWSADAGLAESDVRRFVSGIALPAIALHRGLLPLHASAVARDGDVHAFSGAAAEGKSTLAAALSDRGHAFFADDILILDPVRDAENGLWCWGYDDLKLDSGGLELTGLDPRERVRETKGCNRVYADPHLRSAHCSGRLRSIHVLQRAARSPIEQGQAVQIVRPDAVEVTIGLWRAVHRPGVAAATLGRREIFRRLATTMHDVEVHDVHAFPGESDFAQKVDAVVDRLSAWTAQ